MKNIFVVDASLYWSEETSSFISDELKEKKNTIDFLLDRLNFENFSYILLHTKEFPSELKIKFKNKNFELKEIEKSHSLPELLNKLKKIKDALTADNVGFTYIDSPFLDATINKEIIKMHLDNEAEYTFADNLPDGLSIEMCSSAFLDEIVKNEPKSPELLSRKIFDNVKADINQYYVEVFLPDDDLSLKRIEFHTNTKRNRHLLLNFLKHNDASIDFQNIVQSLEEHPEILFIHPKYVEIEITNKNLKCFFIPKSNRPETFLSLENYKKIIEKITRDYNDIIISLTGLGDPLLHPQFIEIVEYTITQSQIFSLIVETTGRNVTEKIKQALSQYPPHKLQIIFKVDAVSQEVYSKLYEGELELVKNNIESFLSLNEVNGQRTFLQFTKMKENIAEMEPFYRYWKGKGSQIIIQKYNSYAGVLENRTISDLTPLDRLPCWHLQRDLTVLADGTVPVCKQDFDGKIVLGNLIQNELKEILDKMLPFYLDNYSGEFKSLPLCSNCDEWYTYNF